MIPNFIDLHDFPDRHTVLFYFKDSINGFLLLPDELYGEMGYVLHVFLFSPEGNNLGKLRLRGHNYPLCIFEWKRYYDYGNA